MNASDEDLERSFESCEGAALWGAIFVMGGLIMEIAIAFFHPSYDSFIERWGSVIADSAVALGVAAEVLFGRIGAGRQREMQRRSEIKVSAANERAANAELEIARLTAPRTLDGDRWASFVDKLRPFAGQAYDLSIPTMLERGSALHTQLMAALRDAGWKLQSIELSLLRKKLDPVEAAFAFKMPTFSMEELAKLPKIEIGIRDGIIGVLIGFDLGDKMDSRIALLRAFRDAGINAEITSNSPMPFGAEPFQMKETSGVAHIIIGNKN